MSGWWDNTNWWLDERAQRRYNEIVGTERDYLRERLFRPNEIVGTEIFYFDTSFLIAAEWGQLANGAPPFVLRGEPATPDRVDLSVEHFFADVGDVSDDIIRGITTNGVGIL